MHISTEDAAPTLAERGTGWKPSKAKEHALSVDRARELLELDPAIGIVRNRVTRGGRAKAGEVAGTVRSDGYLTISIGGRRYLMHRVVWLLHHGRWPVGILDHINRQRGDNRPENLREVTALQNMANRDQPQRVANLTGLRGIAQRGHKWIAQISIGGRLRHLGRHATPGDAARAYDLAALETHGPGAVTNASLGLLPAAAA